MPSSAITWIATGAEQRPDAALKAGAVDAIAPPETLREVALATLESAMAGKLDYAKRRAAKSSPLPLNDTEAMMAFFTIKAMVGQQAGRNYPAPVKVVEVVEAARGMGLEDALKVESAGFAELAKTYSEDPATSVRGPCPSRSTAARYTRRWGNRQHSRRLPPATRPASE